MEIIMMIISNIIQCGLLQMQSLPFFLRRRRRLLSVFFLFFSFAVE